MADPLGHLRKMKRRLTTQSNSQENMSRGDKVDMLEKSLSSFRAEVNIKLKIMQQILTTRNEQVSVQKKLLEREQHLYTVLLEHWMNTPKLAASGLSMNFSAEVEDCTGTEDYDQDNDGNASDPDYSVEDDLDAAGPSRKKSRSSLRRQRKSGRIIQKQNRTQNDETLESGEPSDQGQGLLSNNDTSFDTEEPLNPPVKVQINDEDYDDYDADRNDFDEFVLETTDMEPLDVSHEVETGYHEIDADIEISENGSVQSEAVDISFLENDHVMDVFHGDLTSGRKRRLKAKPSEWKRSKTQTHRMNGLEYVGRRSKKPNPGSSKSDKEPEVVRKPREMGRTCVSTRCAKSKVTACQTIDEIIRRRIFEKFWQEMDWGKKKVYVSSLVRCIETKAKTTSSQSRRGSTYVYYLNVGDKNVKVCKKMFLSTLGIGEKQIRGWISNFNIEIPASTKLQQRLTRSSKRPKEGTRVRQYSGGI